MTEMNTMGKLVMDWSYRMALLSICVVWMHWAGRAQTAIPEGVSARDSLYLRQIDSSYTYIGSGDWALAEEALRAAIRTQPQHPMTAYLLSNIASLEHIQGEVDQAILTYSAALERAPQEQTIRANRAKLFALIGRHTSAITDYDILVALAPTNEVYRYQRAMAYMMTERYELAESDLKYIIEHNGESLKARLGYALLSTMRKQYDEAERLYDYLVGKLPRSSEVYEGRARLYLARGMRGFAERDMRKAFELAGNRPSATLYRLRAELSRLVGDTETAERDEALAQGVERLVDPLRSLGIERKD